MVQLNDRTNAGRVGPFLRRHPVLSNLGLLLLTLLLLSFSCSRAFTSLIDNEEVRHEQFVRHFGYGLLGPVSQIVETRDLEGVVVLYLAVFAAGMVLLARMKLGCASMLLGAVIAFCWFAVGFMVGGAPGW